MRGVTEKMFVTETSGVEETDKLVDNLEERETVCDPLVQRVAAGDVLGDPLV